MEKVSCKMFFTVMWRGVCQTLGWFFGLFGYNRDGKFAKCVWGVFSISAAIVMGLVAIVLSMEFYDNMRKQYYWANYCKNHGGEFVSETIGYVPDYEDGNGYLINKETGKKVLKGIEWIAKPMYNDSLVCFCSGKRRGYFNANDGKVVVEPKYEHAWIFSEGLAAVDDGGKIKFIDTTGKVVIDNGMTYNRLTNDYVFHGGYLVVSNDEYDKFGLMDRTGKMVLDMKFDEINASDNREYWSVREGELYAVYDNQFNMILPFMEGNLYLTDTSIDVTLPDHTMRKYDYNGNLIYDFYITYVGTLQYDTDEWYYAKDSYVDEEGEEHEYLEAKSKTKTANKRLYTAGNYAGLMGQDGHIITMPLYEEIQAIGPDLYLCTVSNGDKVVINGTGKIVR